MDHLHATPAPRVRRTRAEQKRETRDALTVAALVAFTRDGYHGASLEQIATEAGFSKGAVYSNFGGKAELFLAVMDHTLTTLRGADWDPLAGQEGEGGGAEGADPDPGRGEDDAEEMMRGFGLATLEFVASAARDDTLRRALAERVRVLLDAYGRVAARSRPADDDLPVEDVARLMAALDQGVSVLVLSGVAEVDGALLRTGLRRLLSPSATAEPPPPKRGPHTPPLPDTERVHRLLPTPIDP
ncbi:TetR/AcrR family transcriptional regulator [Streptomonospora sp. S1-112]|uniref:TetR/AcrR family transcriptional regulator n=1 Tax=Streptomonospora mangrovi TaxID=2883123 RepID=A0A9X3SQB3_9ACTN|nr:TetR/AcrR family transcriptional regulator [Streptomonospora mangrovi]MDA0566501.1 TetR/AcrR family transcriptional regulator [Streptomonospora mangrovi]